MPRAASAEIRTRLDTDGLGMLEQRTGGRSFVIESAGVSATPFIRSAVNSHRSISFQLVPAEDKQEIWQWVLAFAVVVFVLAVLFYPLPRAASAEAHCVRLGGRLLESSSSPFLTLLFLAHLSANMLARHT